MKVGFMTRQTEFKIETVCHTLINSAWFLTFVKHDDDTVTILQYERDHMDIEYGMRRGQPVETTGRLVVMIEVEGITEKYRYVVRNPNHVFSYK
jgi:hypothetical protein